MASYRLRFKQSAAKDLRNLPKRDIKRILQRINALAENPRPPGCEKLSGEERYRVRQDKYRIVYAIEDHALVLIAVRVGHRHDVYR